MDRLNKSGVIERFKKNGFTIDEDFMWIIMLIEFALPGIIKDSILCQKTEDFGYDIKYNEVVDYLDNFDYKTKRKALNYIRDYKAQSDTDKYIKHIINNKRINVREKVSVLLLHFEKVLYETAKVTKTKNGIKKDIGKLTEKDMKIGSDSISAVIMFGIAKIVYANTRDFKESIDKRIPFRHNILHNGIVEYRDDDIKKLYEILLIMISELFLFKDRPPKRNK